MLVHDCARTRPVLLPLALALASAAPAVAQFGTTACDALPNSTGAAATLAATGSVDSTVNALQLTSTQLPPGRTALFLVGSTYTAPTPVASSSGVLCLGGSLGRFMQNIVTTGPQGTATIQPDLSALPLATGPAAVQAGDDWTFQLWFRDSAPNGSATSNFSDALSVGFHGDCASGSPYGREQFPSGQYPNSARFADVDGDGDVDAFAVATYSTGFSSRARAVTWSGDGAGNFGDIDIVDLPGVGSSGQIFDIGDLDGDGRLDLAVRADSDVVQTYLRAANGDLTPASDLTLAGHTVQFTRIADFDNDGLDDVVVSSAQFPARFLLLFRSLGGGAFAPPVVSPAAPDAGELTAGDLDGDGFLDVIVLSRTADTLAVHYGTGIGFTLGAVTPVGADPESIVLGDADGDGDLDAFVALEGDSRVDLLRNDGTGAWTATTTVGSIQSYSYGGTDLALADLDGDTFPELAVSNMRAYGSITVLEDVALGGGLETTTHVSRVNDVSFGDVDGDGEPDLLYLTLGGAIGFLEGDGRAAQALDRNYPVRDFVSMLALADFDGDGLEDAIVLSSTEDTIGIAPGLPGGAFGTVVQWQAFTESPGNLSVGDIDDDGDLDILATSGDSAGFSTIHTLLNDQGVLGAPVSLPFAVPYILDVAVGDLGAGGTEVLVCANDAIFAWHWTGTNYATRLVFTAPSIHDIDIVDIDQDGDLDIAAVDSQGRFVHTAWNAGSGMFPTVLRVMLPHTITDVAWADVDGDGFVDLAAGSAAGVFTDLAIVRNVGGQSFAAPELYPRTMLSNELKAADLDADGDVDLVFCHWGGRFDVHTNDGTGSFVFDDSFGSAGRAQASAIADVNADGLPDFVTGSGPNGVPSLAVQRRLCR